jgi:hypothetical protein
MESDWKQAKCGQCEFWVPLGQGESDTGMEQVNRSDGGECRARPPGLYGIRRKTMGFDGTEFQAHYPPIDESHPACSLFKEVSNELEG